LFEVGKPGEIYSRTIRVELCSGRTIVDRDALGIMMPLGGPNISDNVISLMRTQLTLAWLRP